MTGAADVSLFGSLAMGGNAMPEAPLPPGGYEQLAAQMVEGLGEADALAMIEDAAATHRGDKVIAMKIKPPLPCERAGGVKPVLNGQWLVKGVIPAKGLVAVFGHSGSGKSFWTVDAAAHIASGRDWNGRRVKGGLVLYVVAEGQSGFRNRVAAMLQAEAIWPHTPFVFVPVPLDLFGDDGDIDALIGTVQLAAANEGQEPAIVVIDTLSKTFGAGKENTDDMARYVANCQRILSALQCTVLVVHHRPKNEESRDMRGHSSLRAGVDAAILIEGGDIRTATVVKQKDGEEGQQWRFVLDKLVLGRDEDDEEVSSCLVRYLPVQPKGELDQIARAATDNEIFIECLRERNRQHRAVSEKRSATYAPTEFARMPESKKIGKERLEQAMDRLFRTGRIERAELWKNDHRRPVIGLREVAAADARKGAADGAADSLRSTRQTVPNPAEMRAADAANTHTPYYVREGAAPDGASAPSDWNPDGF